MDDLAAARVTEFPNTDSKAAAHPTPQSHRHQIISILSPLGNLTIVVEHLRNTTGIAPMEGQNVVGTDCNPTASFRSLVKARLYSRS